MFEHHPSVSTSVPASQESPTDSPTAVFFFSDVLQMSCERLCMSYCECLVICQKSSSPKFPNESKFTRFISFHLIPSHSISIPMGSSKPGTRRHGGGAGRAGRAGRATPREARWDLHKHLASYLPYIHLATYDNINNIYAYMYIYIYMDMILYMIMIDYVCMITY